MLLLLFRLKLMNVYFLRHGQSLFNFDPSNDLIDCSLTELGIKQSIDIHFQSFPQHYSLVLCSPLSRCIQTLEYSNITFDSMEINHLFREIQSGCRSDLLNENESISIDTEQQIQQRIDQIHDYLFQIKDKFQGENLLIVSHADLIWHLTAKEIQGELFGTWLNNAELLHWKLF